MLVSYLKHFIMFISMVLPMHLMAQQSKEQLFYDPNLVSFDAEIDSMHYYPYTPPNLIERLFNITVAKTQTLKLMRNIGEGHYLDRYFDSPENDPRLVSKTGIRDKNGIIYWADKCLHKIKRGIRASC